MVKHNMLWSLSSAARPPARTPHHHHLRLTFQCSPSELECSNVFYMVISANELWLTHTCLDFPGAYPDRRELEDINTDFFLSHHCQGSNPVQDLPESDQWLGVGQWLSMGTVVSFTTYNWLIMTKPVMTCIIAMNWRWTKFQIQIPRVP